VHPSPRLPRPAEGPDDYAALTRGLHRVASAPTSVRRTRSIGTTAGSKNVFWTFIGAIGAGGSTYAQRSATLKAVTANAYIWIDDFEAREDLVRDTAHELQHDINFVNHAIVHGGNSSEETWLNEG